MVHDLKSAVEAALVRARLLPAGLAQLEQLDPQLAARLESKPLVASRSPWGTLVAAAVGYFSTRYGLGLDDHTVEVVAGVSLLVGGYAMRVVTSRPIGGLLRTPTA